MCRSLPDALPSRFCVYVLRRSSSSSLLPVVLKPLVFNSFFKSTTWNRENEGLVRLIKCNTLDVG